jgi:hypothetical protein
MRRQKDHTLADLAKSINIENFTRSKLVQYLQYIGELDRNGNETKNSSYVMDKSWVDRPRKIIVKRGAIERFNRDEIDKLKKWLLDRNL